MNAIITLNHFCDIHGPQVIFTTQTLRDQLLIDSKNDELKSSSNNDCKSPCGGCSSIGNKLIFRSEDKESSLLFVSSEKTLFGSDILSLLKSTALRSLSCEITSENLVFFGNSVSNSLSYTFKVKDSQARGFEKLYSIVVVMKDKMFLLNTQPFLSKNLKEAAKHIQDCAQKVFDSEQKLFSPRAERLNSGKASSVPPRPLNELTGETNIFAHLHSLFSWTLWTGSRNFTEVLTIGTPVAPPTLKKEDVDGFTFVQVDREDFLMNHYQSTSESESQKVCFNLRTLKNSCNSSISFNQLLYCSLIGIQIVVRGPIQRSTDFLKYFKNFLPEILHGLIFESTKYVSVNKCRILALPADAVIPNTNVCRVELMNDDINPSLIKCSIELPTKLPQLMIKILHAIDEKLFSNQTLDKYLRAVIEEWKNNVVCFSYASNDSTKLKKVLGIQSQDELLINYWLSVI